MTKLQKVHFYDIMRVNVMFIVLYIIFAIILTLLALLE
jgi:hypothetical protein